MKGTNGKLYIGDQEIQSVDSFALTIGVCYPRKLTLELNMTVADEETDDKISAFLAAAHGCGVNINLHREYIEVRAKDE